MPPRSGPSWDEILFEKKYDKKGKMDKDIKKIKQILNGIGVLSLECDRTHPKIDNPDISERIINYGYSSLCRYYAYFTITALDDNYLEVKIQHYGEMPALDLRSKISKELKQV